VHKLRRTGARALAHSLFAKTFLEARQQWSVHPDIWGCRDDLRGGRRHAALELAPQGRVQSPMTRTDGRPVARSGGGQRRIP